ncbi:hypothetical protein [Limnothrix sp. FACHB-708]|nr:hypothetical protein [Limnothrix sp. FACHB-708]
MGTTGQNTDTQWRLCWGDRAYAVDSQALNPTGQGQGGFGGR